MTELDASTSATTIPENRVSRAKRQRLIDFDILAPLTILGVLISALAIVIAFAANQSNGPAAAAAPNAAAAGDSATAGGYGGGENTAPTTRVTEEKPDFTAKTYDPVTKPVKAGPKTFELTATEKNIKVGAKTYKMWTFNNTVPGPVLRAVVGDKITIKITNASDSKLPHSVDYHASRLTLGGGHVQVAPGKSGTFEFTAEYPGVFMYHCATAPVLHHIGMGMYGMLIVQPKEGFGPKMPEYAITQSELYASSKDIDENRPDSMAFNGVPSQYAAKPLRLPADSNVRMFVMNAGPSEVSSFHVVGTVFDRVFEDGNPRNVSFGRQALGIPASGSGVFEMQLKGEGQFPFVTHQFNHAAKGAVGMMISGDGKPGPGGVEDAGANGHH
ncbi:MAG: nitrite reductase [Thermoleophilia bacterium]|nr:nitrite reductase [Thermoleophilia bacterium]